MQNRERLIVTSIFAVLIFECTALGWKFVVLISSAFNASFTNLFWSDES